VTYRQGALWLTDEELAALRTELRAAITSRMGNGPGAGRARFLLSTILLPADPARNPQPPSPNPKPMRGA